MIEDVPQGYSPGSTLRAARVARNLTVTDVAHALKLAPRQIEAIEADAFEQLRGLTFARGFVRNYARYLGLDPEPLAAMIVSNDDPRQVELAPVSNAQGDMPVAKSSFGALIPALMTLAALIAVAVLGWQFGWYRVPDAVDYVQKMEGSSSAAGHKADVPATSDSAVAPAAASAPAAEASSAAQSGQTTQAVLPPIAAASTAEPVPSAASSAPTPAPAASTALATPPAPAPVAASTPPAPEVPAPREVKGPPPPGVQRLAFEFDGDSWIEIKDAKGKTLHSQLHKAGSAQDVDLAGAAPYAVVIGNAGKVKLHQGDKLLDLAPHTKVSVARLSLK